MSRPTPRNMTSRGDEETEMNPFADAATSNDMPPATNITHQKNLLESNWSWTMELRCWAAGVICLLGIVGVLFPYHDKPLPHLPRSVKLNTIASTLATFAAAFLMVPVSSALGQLKWNWYCTSRSVAHFDKHDQASRGASGSFKLLFSGPVFSLAPIGALWIILSLGIGPFVQQVITYPQRSVYVVDATVSAAMKFGNTSQTNSSAEPYLIGAAYNGLYADFDARIQVTPSCLTGNCTFPSFDTLSICSDCSSVSAIHNATAGTFTLPNYFSLEPGDPEDVAMLNISNTLSIPTGGYKPNFASINYSQNGSLLLDFFGIVNGSGFECILQWCVRELAATESGGDYQEKLLRAWSNDTNAAAGVQKPGNPAGVEPPTIIPEITYYLTSPWSDTIFRVGSVQQTYLSISLANMFQGEVHDYGRYMNEVGGMTEPIQALYGILSGGIAPNITALNQTMSNIAAALSVAVRNNAVENLAVHGVALTDEVYVHVEWIWLAYPAALALLALIFLVLVRLDTQKKIKQHTTLMLGVFKNDSLPVLLFGLNDSARSKLTIAATAPDAKLEKICKTTEMRIQANTTGVPLSLTT